MKKEIKKSIDLSGLPRYKSGANKGKICWSECVRHSVSFIYENIEGEINIEECIGEYIVVRYLDCEPYKIMIDAFRMAKIKNVLGKYAIKYKFNIGESIVDGSRNLIITDRKIIKNDYGLFKKYYKYKCNNCGFCCDENYVNGERRHEHWITEDGLNRGNGCVCCSGGVVVTNINSIWHTDSWMYHNLGISLEVCKSRSKYSKIAIEVVCKNCGKKKMVKMSNAYKTKSIGCSCGDGFSYAHKYIYAFLKQLNVIFKEEVRFDWCYFHNPFKNKDTFGIYDFVIDEMNLIIEADGEFHRNDNRMNGNTIEESKFIDDIKDKISRDNGYCIIRISNDGDIKNNILNSNLNNIFNLFNIDWIKCEEVALKNIVKEVCNIKLENPNMSAVEIGKVIGIDHTTAIRYLKKGAKLGWCDYNSEKERFNGCSKSGKMSGKKVEVFKNGLSLGVFDSCRQLSEISEGLFGINLLLSGISAVCRGVRDHHKNYTFKYVTE